MGHVKYLVFYLSAGVVATLSHWLIDPGSNVPLIGVIGGGDSEALSIFFFTWGFIPVELTRGEALTGVIETPTPTWTTIFSSLFMHGGLMHFAGNMMFLWVFGDNIEDRMGHRPILSWLVTPLPRPSALTTKPSSKLPPPWLPIWPKPAMW